MKALLVAAAILLPPNATGIWSGETQNGFIDLSDDGFFYSSTKDGRAVETRCVFLTQDEGMWGYTVKCGDGGMRKMLFYKTGVMEFDGIRFIFGDCPKGCPE